MTRNLIGGLAGAVLGGLFLDGEGVIPGFLVGILFAVAMELRRRVGELERRLGISPESAAVPPPAGEASASARASRRYPPGSHGGKESESPALARKAEGTSPVASSPPPPPPPPESVPPASAEPASESAKPVSESEEELEWEIPAPPGSEPVSAAESESVPVSATVSKSVSTEDADHSAAPPIPPSTPPPSEPETPRWQTSIREFLTGGNLVVRAGVVILFFGVAFLLKYAAEQGLVPIEFRLAGVALGGIALLVLGWRLRESRKGYAVTLQGAGVGVLYLTLFTAARLYDLIPLGLTFFLMVALVVLSGVLAVLQDALPLAVFGALGGFLAPVLASTGRGSHVALFSYYTLLNAGILQVAWYRSWRILNLIGFFFTFGVGTVWGFQYYRSVHYATVQPFLLLYFLFYVAISVLFAHRLPVKLRGMVDGTLVFGLPIVVFALQARLVARFDYGLPFSALALSAFYVGLASALWRRAVTGMRLLAESFLALGVVFGSLAIPLALDGRWTAAAWAMEGAALVWIGVRQNRALARNFGLLLQFGAGFSFIVATGGRGSGLPFLNGVFLGGVVVSLAGLFSSAYLERNAEALRRWERGSHVLFLIWGLLWWLGIWGREIEWRLSGSLQEEPAFLALVSLTALALGELSRRIRWRSARVPAGMLLPVLLLSAGDFWGDSLPAHPFTRWFIPAWTIAFGVHFRLLFRFETLWRSGIVRLWHLGGVLLMVFLVSWETAWWVDRWVAGAAWDLSVWGLLPALTVLGLLGPARNIRWPVARQTEAYLGMAPAALIFCAFLWFLGACLQAGNPDPLPWFPVLNPLDLSQAFVLVVAVVWLRAAREAGYPEISPEVFRGLGFSVGACVFLWLNAVTGRAVHFWAGVRYAAEPLFESDLFQAAISILWSLAALGLMAGAARRESRPVWIFGGTLLGLVVVKLFFVDLAGSGTVPRIISFIGAGVLMLVIGYLAPLPPRREAEDSGAVGSE